MIRRLFASTWFFCALLAGPSILYVGCARHERIIENGEQFIYGIIFIAFAPMIYLFVKWIIIGESGFDYEK